MPFSFSKKGWSTGENVPLGICKAKSGRIWGILHLDNSEALQTMQIVCLRQQHHCLFRKKLIWFLIPVKLVSQTCRRACNYSHVCWRGGGADYLKRIILFSVTKRNVNVNLNFPGHMTLFVAKHNRCEIILLLWWYISYVIKIFKYKRVILSKDKLGHFLIQYHFLPLLLLIFVCPIQNPTII